MLAAFTFSRISFGPGVGIGSFRNFITSREPNLSIMTTSIVVMKHSLDLLQFQIADYTARPSKIRYILAPVYAGSPVPPCWQSELRANTEHYRPVTAVRPLLLLSPAIVATISSVLTMAL